MKITERRAEHGLRARVVRSVIVLSLIGWVAMVALIVPGSAVAADITAMTVSLTWSAPGDDGSVGTASQYDIRYAVWPITQSNWADAVQCIGEPIPRPAGSLETYTVMNLTPGTQYYIAIMAADEVPNWSMLSNVLTVRTDVALSAAFSGSPTSGLPPLTVSFTDQSVGDVTGWEWDFGDGQTSVETNPSHTFADSGSYTVSLTVSGPSGSATETKADYIIVSDVVTGGPTAAFSGAPTTGCAPLVVSFADGSDGEIDSWSWDFGDGRQSGEQNPAHTYDRPGVYTVSLTVSNPEGSDRLVRSGYVRVSAQPLAAFSGLPVSGCRPLQVTFTNESTGDITSWAWDFGDGGTSDEQNPTHVYETSGGFTVSLMVTGPCGRDTVTLPDQVVVADSPAASFSALPLSGCATLTVGFTDQSTGENTVWEWSFGDGESSGDQNPVHTYMDAGTYDVSLIVTAVCGGLDTMIMTDYIVVGGSPVADFSAFVTSGSEPLAVNFSPLFTTDVTAWEWDFGDGAMSQQKYPYHIYRNPGNYTVSLSATGPCGSDTVIRTDYISVTGHQGYSLSFAQMDLPVRGTVLGDYTMTATSDNIYQVITEVASQIDPSNSYSTLEHGWSFDVVSGGAVTFYVEAYRPDNDDHDNFAFEYSLDGASFFHLVTINSAAEEIYSASLPGGIAGTVYIRVVDTDTTSGRQSFDSICIDFMYIESGGEPPPADTLLVSGIEVTQEMLSDDEYRARAVVTIQDQRGFAVSGATVYGHFTGPSSQLVSDATVDDGTSVFVTAAVAEPEGYWYFYVDHVVCAGSVYDPSLNVETYDMAKAAGLPEGCQLAQNYPNPFNPVTVITFFLPEASPVRLDIYNIMGQCVTTLVEGYLQDGYHSFDWNGHGRSSGVYFYRLQAGSFAQTRKMILMK
ncbi:MAG: PKD domain-containing protein [candidate division Zixibacteria bacterium]|nr:PKD domain-containing protein [candidate division Zixibacteria bacterium]